MKISSKDILANMSLIRDEMTNIQNCREECMQKLEDVGLFWSGDDRDAFLSLAVDYYINSETIEAYIAYLNVAEEAYNNIFIKGQYVQQRVANLGYLLT